jgi:hypothetical protein
VSSPGGAGAGDGAGAGESAATVYYKIEKFGEKGKAGKR